MLVLRRILKCLVPKNFEIKHQYFNQPTPSFPLQTKKHQCDLSSSPHPPILIPIQKKHAPFFGASMKQPTKKIKNLRVTRAINSSQCTGAVFTYNPQPLVKLPTEKKKKNTLMIVFMITTPCSPPSDCAISLGLTNAGTLVSFNHPYSKLLLILQGLKRPPPSEGCPVQMVAIKKWMAAIISKFKVFHFIAW